MDTGNEEIIRFFDAMQATSVRYILVGGLAVNYYGYNRSTGDVDLWIEDNNENRKAFVEALTRYGIQGADIYERIPFLARYSEIVLNDGTPVDIISNLQFFDNKQFSGCYDAAKDLKKSESAKVKVLHINSLIEEKEQSQRQKDRLDVEMLRKIQGSK